MSDELDDLLARATAALRETSAQPEPRSGLTRARVLDAAERRYARRRSPVLRWAIVLVGGLCASSALARVAQHWPEIKRAFLADSAHEAAPARPKPKRSSPVKAPPAVPAPASAVPDVNEVPVQPARVPVAEPSAPVERVERKPGAARPRRVEGSAGAATPPPLPPPMAAAEPAAESPAPAPESAELALFRRAQRLHLARDPAALGAWDDYLRVAGHGPLAPEARYNRALSLVRLGRTAAARAALEPFARGDFGDYRQREARRLLEALGQPSRADSPARER